MSNASNITIRADVNRPVTYEELDANFSELKFVISEYNDFYNNIYLPHVQAQDTENQNLQGQIDSNDTELTDHEQRITQNRTDIDQNAQNYTDHLAADDPHPQYVLKVKNNLSATTDPTINDDVNAGYSVFSKWINTSTEEIWVCVDDAAGAANWQTLTLTVDDLGTAAVVNMGTSPSEIRTNQQNDDRFTTDQESVSNAITFSIALG